MTQRRKSQSIVLLMTVVFSAVLLWALAAVVWPVPRVYADDPDIEIAKSPDSQPVQSGDTVTFTIAVTNTGNVTLTVTVSDTLAPGCDANLGSLAPTQSTTYTCPSPAVTGDFTNTVIVTGTPPVGDAVTDTDTAFVDVLPTITVTKTADPTSVPEPGGTVTFTVWVDNTSLETVTLTTLTDTVHGNLDGQGTCAVTQTIAAAGFYTCAFTATVSGNHGDVVTDTVTATASDDENNSVQASDEATVTIVDLTNPVITAITVTSDSPTYFYDPGLGDAGGGVFFNSLDGEGGGQTITVTVSFTDAHPYSLAGDTAFGDSPGPDFSGPPWTLSYTIEAGASSETNRVFTVTDQAGNTDTAVITFTQDITDPTIVSPTLNETSNFLHADDPTLYYSDLMGGTAQSFTVQGNAADNSGGAGLYRATFSPAFEVTPPNDYSPASWSGTYDDVESTDSGNGTITVTVYDNVSNWSTGVFTYIEDTTNPTVTLTDVTNPGYDSADGELDDDGSNWYNAGDFIGTTYRWYFTSTTSDGGAGLASGSAFLNHSSGTTHDQTEDCGSDGSGFFSWLGDDPDGVVTVTVTISDHVGNSASDTVVFNIDNTGPSITSPYISESSPYLHVDNLTVYYGDDMGSGQEFIVNGSSNDIRVGLNRARFSGAFGSTPDDDTTPSIWSGRYYPNNQNWGNGTITVTVYDLLDNPATQVFTYTRDTDNPTSVAGSPQYANGNPIIVTYTNATDTGGSGLQRVWLWYKKEVTGTWITSSLPAQTGPSGSFNFTPSSGDGTYYFATRAEDNVGNQEIIPDSDDYTVYDTTKPSVPGNFAYQNDSDSGGDGFSPEAGYYDDPVIQLQWEASTDGGSGLLTPPYHLGTAPHPTGGSYAINSPYDVGSSGTYNIYLTAEDNAGNISDDAVTGPITVDNQPPQGSVVCPASTAEKSFTVSWSANDQGPAGLRSNPYSVWYNVDGGDWQPWFMNTSATMATFGPDSPITVAYGHTYCFRMRAADRAGNVQYTLGNNCTATIDPTANLEKVFLPIVMAPDPNWGFETGDFTNWQHGGQLAQSVSTAMPHSGSYSALLGSPSYACNNVPVGSAWLRRSVTVPSSGSPTLSFWYRIYSQDKNSALSDQYDLFAVYINDSVEVVRDANTSDPYGCSTLKDLGWKQVNFSLNAYKGQTIQITFYNYNRAPNGAQWYNTYTYVDDVAVQ